MFPTLELPGHLVMAKQRGQLFCVLREIGHLAHLDDDFEDYKPIQRIS